MPTLPAPSAAARPAGAIRSYFRDSAGASQSAALTLPLLCLYGVGVLLVPEARNGVDFVSDGLHVAFSSFGPMRGFAYLVFYGMLIGANLGLVAWLSKKKRFNVRYFWPLLAECAVYAVATGTISGTVTQDLTSALQATGPALSTTREHGLLAGVIISAGAGLHEELVFRLLGIGAVAWLWLGKDWRRPSLRLLGLVLASSVLFSAVHHIVEPFSLTALVFRTVAGLLFAALFLLRGFAVAAWTHALYDVWVIVLLGL